MNYNEEVLKDGYVEDGRSTLSRHKIKKWKERDPSKFLGVVYHQSLENYGTASGNAKYHTGPNHISKNGLPGLSYTMFGEKSGKVILANDIEDSTYSQGARDIPGDENALYLAVCWGGNFSAPGYVGLQRPTEEQLKAAELLWYHLKSIWGFKNNQLFGHYDFGKATCPGTIMTQIIETINQIKDWNEPEFDLSSSAGRQEALAHLGYYRWKLDGHWGPLSRYALSEFQKNANLIIDGVWGKKTNTAITLALTI